MYRVILSPETSYIVYVIVTNIDVRLLIIMCVHVIVYKIISLFTLDKDEVMCGGVGAGVGCWLPRPLLGDGGGAESGDESSEKRVSLPLSMFNPHNRRAILECKQG